MVSQFVSKIYAPSGRMEQGNAKQSIHQPGKTWKNNIVDFLWTLASVAMPGAAVAGVGRGPITTI